MYKEDLALNNLAWLICNKTQPNQTKPQIIEAHNILFNYPIVYFKIIVGFLVHSSISFYETHLLYSINIDFQRTQTRVWKINQLRSTEPSSREHLWRLRLLTGLLHKLERWWDVHYQEVTG